MSSNNGQTVAPLPIGEAIAFYRQNVVGDSVDALTVGWFILQIAEAGGVLNFPPDLMASPPGQMYQAAVARHLERIGKKSNIILPG